jgi:hypothetical protein
MNHCATGTSESSETCFFDFFPPFFCTPKPTKFNVVLALEEARHVERKILALPEQTLSETTTQKWLQKTKDYITSYTTDAQCRQQYASNTQYIQQLNYARTKNDKLWEQFKKSFETSYILVKPKAKAESQSYLSFGERF